MKRTCHWPGCKNRPIFIRKIRRKSGGIVTQIRADDDHGLCLRHTQALEESIRAIDRINSAREGKNYGS